MVFRQLVVGLCGENNLLEWHVSVFNPHWKVSLTLFFLLC